MTDAPGSATRQFPIRIGARSRLFLRFFFGVRPGHDFVALDGDAIQVRFGWYNPRVPVANVERWRIEGPWRWITAIGTRVNWLNRETSFCGSPRGGVRLDLRDKLHYGPMRIPAIYVGVEDLEGFAAALAERGIPGEDARTAKA